MTLAQAAALIHRYGKLADSPEELLAHAPKESRLALAKHRCHTAVDEAFRLIRKHFEMEENDA